MFELMSKTSRLPSTFFCSAWQSSPGHLIAAFSVSPLHVAASEHDGDAGWHFQSAKIVAAVDPPMKPALAAPLIDV